MTNDKVQLFRRLQTLTVRADKNQLSHIFLLYLSIQITFTVAPTVGVKIKTVVLHVFLSEYLMFYTSS